MSLAFVNLVLAPLAALALIPLLVHLFARSRPPRYAFSSLEFLRRVMRQTLRVKRPRDWIVLLLRTLLALGLVALFLRPIARSGASGSPFERRHVVVVIDRSASMGALAGGRSRFAAACAEASELLADLGRRDAANVVWMDASPDAVFPELGPNVPYLLDAVRVASVSFEAADVEQALHLALAMLRDADGSREIDVVSDFQATAWRDFRLPDLEGVSLVAVPADGRPPAANVALTDLALTPAEPLPGESVSVSCTVWNYGGNPVRPSLFLRAGEFRQSRELFLAPWSRAAVQFDVSFPAAGDYAVVAEGSEDGFAADNARHAVARVRPHLRAAVVGPRTPTAEIWERALRALGLFHVENHASLATLEGDEDALVAADWNGEQPERLRQAARQGAAVVCAPAPGLEASALYALLSSDSPVPEHSAPLARHAPSTPLRLHVAAPDDPLFALFSQGAYGDPARGSFHAALALPPLPPDAVALLSYDAGLPALARLGRDSLYLWNLDLDPANTDWPQYAAFLPLFGELFLGPRSRTSGHDDHVPGIPIPLDVPPGTPVDVQTLSGMDAPPQRLASAPDAPIRLLPAAPGLFEWRSPEAERRGLLAVNLLPGESDLRPLPDDDVRGNLSSTLVSGRRARDLREGVEAWPWMLALCLAWALLEGLALWNWEGRR
ncbi:MAG: VWA domain-containing protein [Kiritimatiellia bacterium]